jgi:hypothetical protein
VSQPTDPHEQEAEQVARSVTDGCDGCDEAEPCADCADRNVVHRASREASAADASPSPDALAAGRPLDTGTRTWFEGRLGAPLDEVRIHTGRAPAESARRLNARAFTIDNDVAFGEGEYSPGTTAGKRLLAHELTHVIQGQRGQVVRSMVHRQPLAAPAPGVTPPGSAAPLPVGKASRTATPDRCVRGRSPSSSRASRCPRIPITPGAS